MRPHRAFRSHRGAAAAAVAVFLIGCRGPLESSLPAGAPRTLRDEARACDNGDSIACSNVASAFEAGEGVPVDQPRAEAMYRVACDGGAWLACINLAQILQDQGLDDIALGMLESACEGGEALACLRAGQAVDGAAESDADEARALAFFQRACTALIGAACVEVGRYTRAGRAGLEPDEHAAAVLFAQVCDRGEPSGCEEYGMALLGGRGFPRDEELALATLERACISEQVGACRTLWDSYAHGANAVAVNVELGAHFARLACERGAREACVAEGTGEGSANQVAPVR